MNKIKTRHAKRAMHAKRRGKHTTRKGYRKYRKHYTQKNVKRIQCQGKGKLRKQRHTRRKVGGEPIVREFNFRLPITDERFEDIEIQGQGWAYVTKLGSFLSQSDRPEQLIIFKKKDVEENPTGNYFIARCSFAMCNMYDDKNIEKEILETSSFDKETKGNTSSLSYIIVTPSGKKYRIKPANTNDPARETLVKFFNNYPEQMATDAAATEAEANAATLPVMSEKDGQFQELMDSINFLQPSIDDIRKMLKVTNDTTCSFLCNPDECDETMLEKLRQKYMEKIKNSNSVSETDDAIGIFFNTLDENLFLILENFYVQSKILTEEKLKELFSQCDQQLSYSLIDSRSTHKNLHGIMNMLYKKIRESILKNDSYLQQNLENMQKLLQLLNSMTPENMQKLLQLLKSMTPENMQKLLQLLNSMTPENMQKLLQLLNSMTPENMQKLLSLLESMTPENMQKLLSLLESMTPENMELILSALNNIITEDNKHPSAPSRIGELLNAHLILDEKSMSKLLDFYSFIEIKKMQRLDNKYEIYEIIAHKYKDGKTPFLKNLSFGNELPSTCHAIGVLNKSFEMVDLYFKMAFEFKKGLELRNTWDAKLRDSQTKCKMQNGAYFST